MHQVHGATVRVVRAGGAAHTGPLPKADSVVTDDARAVVGVRVADCAPVLIASGDGRVVAAVHARKPDAKDKNIHSVVHNDCGR